MKKLRGEKKDVLMRIPDDLLSRIDKKAAARGIARHQLILQLIENGLLGNLEIREKIEKEVRHEFAKRLQGAMGG